MRSKKKMENAFLTATEKRKIEEKLQPYIQTLTFDRKRQLSFPKMAAESLKDRIRRFKHDDGDTREVTIKAKVETNRIKKVRSQKDVELKDLQPSLRPGIVVLFIGFNPGIESSLQQHHYAHFTNLFWKLFNRSQLLSKVLEASNYAIKPDDKLVHELLAGKAKAEHDFRLIDYNIGFTDLVLRCTRTAQELTMSEKLQNVPRLLGEFKSSGTQNLVFIGKGIWEIVVKYLSREMGVAVKLTKENFAWGLQTGTGAYKQMLEKFWQLCGHEMKIYVFPNTSGLVTSLKYEEKERMWVELANNVGKP